MKKITNTKRKKCATEATGPRVYCCSNCQCQLPNSRDRSLLLGLCAACSAERAARLAGATAKVVAALGGSLSFSTVTFLLSAVGASPDMTEAEAQTLAKQFTIPPPLQTKVARPAPAQTKPAEAPPIVGAPPPSRPVARFMRLHQLRLPKFGISGQGEPPEEGEEILVRTKAGALRVVIVDRILWTGTGYYRGNSTWCETEHNWEATFQD